MIPGATSVWPPLSLGSTGKHCWSLGIAATPAASAAAGPFLTLLYGCGELPQAFCRVAAVGGAVQVLRCGIEGLAFDEHTFSCIGVELTGGQVCVCVSCVCWVLPCS